MTRRPWLSTLAVVVCAALVLVLILGRRDRPPGSTVDPAAESARSGTKEDRPVSSLAPLPTAAKENAGDGSPAVTPQVVADTAATGPVRRLSIVGRIVDERRIGVGGADVRWAGEPFAGPGVRSDALGRFRLPIESRDGGAWLRGVVRVRAGDRAATASVSAGIRAGEDIDAGSIELRPATLVVVRVVAHGKPMPGARVVLVAFADVESGSPSPEGEATSDADGIARFEGVAPGWANAWARAPDGSVGRADGAVVAHAETTALEVEVKPPHTLDVLVETDGEPPKPVPNATVSVRMTLRQSERLHSVLDYAPKRDAVRTGPDGHARIDGLVQGEEVTLTAWADGFVGVRAPTRYIDVNSATVTLERPSMLAFPLRMGERPVPPDGTRLRVLRRADEPARETAGSIEGGKIVVPGDGEEVRGIAIGPDGSMAALLDAMRTEEPGRETWFAAPRKLVVRFMDADGRPVPGADAWLAGSRFGSFLRWSERRRADADGRVAFENLPPWTFTIHGFGTASDDWGVEFGDADLSAGDAAKDVVVGRESAVVARVTIDGKAGLPSGVTWSLGGAIVVASEEDGARGTLQMRARAPNGDDESGSIEVKGRGFRPARAGFPWPKAGETATVDLALGTTPEVVVEIRADPANEFYVDFQRWDSERGRWVESLRWAPGEVSPVTEAGRKNVDLAAGRYRLNDVGTGLVSEPFEVPEHGGRVEATLDLTGLVAIRGRIEVPEGADVRKAMVVVEGPGIDMTNEYGPGRGVREKDGAFEVRVPAGRQVTLRPWHSVLRPAAKDEGRVEVVGPHDDVVLRLVEGPKIRLRLLDPAGEPLSKEAMRYAALLVIPAGKTHENGARQSLAPSDDGRASASGFPVGEADVWVDAEEFAPRRIEHVRVVDGETDLHDIRLEAGATVTIRRIGAKAKDVTRFSAVATWAHAPEFTREPSDDEESADSLRIRGLAAGKWSVQVTSSFPEGDDVESVHEIEVDGRNGASIEVEVK